jgi:L-phenylalanine/L-methionine N-acetyltransferase
MGCASLDPRRRRRFPCYRESTMQSTESNLKSLYGHRYSLRRREKSDCQALFELFKQPLCQQGLISDAFASPAHFQSWIDNAGPDILDIVATGETAVIGYAGLFLGRENRGHVGSLSLFVHDEFHSRGIGGLLMQGILAVADAMTQLRRIELFVVCDNQRAVDLYRRFGFEIEGRHDCFARRKHNFVDVYTMSRIAKSGSDC